MNLLKTVNDWWMKDHSWNHNPSGIHSAKTPGWEGPGPFPVCAFVKDKSLWTKIGTKSCTLLSFNPVVTIISLAIILGFAVWAMLR